MSVPAAIYSRWAPIYGIGLRVTASRAMLADGGLRLRATIRAATCRGGYRRLKAPVVGSDEDHNIHTLIRWILIRWALDCPSDICPQSTATVHIPNGAPPDGAMMGVSGLVRP
jgi:hypothetical protein